MNKYIQQSINHLLSVMLVVIVLALSACHSESDGPKPPVVEPEEVGRTVLVYMLSSNNSLGDYRPCDYDIQDIDEMLKAAKAGDITDGRLLVFHSASNGNQILKEITPDGKVDTLKVYDPTVVPQTNVRMTEVLDDMESVAPARDYGLVLWGHGSGWLEDGIEDVSSIVQTYSYGSENYNSRKMNITSLAETLEGRNLSFIYFDCCYMASVEVAYQLRNVTPYIVAYSTEILAYGMPYDANVKHFFSSVPDLKQAAQNTFDFYDAMTRERYRMCTVSVINTAALDRLAAVTKDIYTCNRIGIPAGFVPQNFQVSRPYYYFDMGSYVRALPVNSFTEEFDAAMDEVVELKLSTERIWDELTIREHSGLSTFIIESERDLDCKNYRRLDWYADVASALSHN